MLLTSLAGIGGLGATSVLGAIPFPVASGAVDAGDRVQVHVISNGFHSDIVLPATGRTLERIGLDPSDFPVERGAVSGWAIGWGSRTAYTSLRAVSDLTPDIVAKAIAFDDTVMHVAPVGPLLPGDGVWAVDLAPSDYDRLVDSIAEGFAADRTALPGLTQGFADRFYAGAGRFTAWYGCNAWVGTRLRDAGVPVGLWTPTAQSLAFGLDRLL